MAASGWEGKSNTVQRWSSKLYISLEHITGMRHLERVFFRYCCMRFHKLLKYLCLYFVVNLGAFFHVISREKYLTVRWRFLRDLPDPELWAERFWKKRKIWVPEEDLVVVLDHPELLISGLCRAHNWKLTANAYDAAAGKFAQFSNRKELVPERIACACGSVGSWLLRRAEKPVYLYEIAGKQRKTSRKAVAVCAMLGRALVVWIGLLVYAILLGHVSLYFAGRAFPDYTELYAFYTSDRLLVCLNIAPIIWLIVLCYLLFNRAYLAVLCTSAITMILSWINYFKILFRDDPFMIEDLFIAMEARVMAGQYDVVFSRGMILTVILMVVAVGVFWLFARQRVVNAYLRTALLVLVVIIGMVGFSQCYLKDTYYYRLPEMELMNRWSPTHNFMRRGFVYPFLNSTKEAIDKPPAGYSKHMAEDCLSEFNYADIDEDKKVNVIAIMLEAYGDFTCFEELEFVEDPYAYFHQLAEESYSGTLLNNIFAAGTVNTERCVLTGYTTLPSFRKVTNSYAWYFAEQGYTVEGSHPSYQWFYNRANANSNLGFANYYFDENMYMALNEGQHVADNDILLPNIVNLYEEALARGEHYFSFNVTYQGHGPYSAEAAFANPYITRQNLTEADFNTINNYFEKMAQVDASIEDMIETLRASDEPVVVIFFGDHMPWMGDGNSIYHALGINIDLSTEEGFYNYYSTPYLIWANDAAKQTLGNDFVGEGPTIGPYFLMNEFFALAGYTGNEYLQYTSQVHETFDAIHDDGFYRIDGNLVTALNAEQQEVLNEFLGVQYYWRNNFRSSDMLP